jgi:GGDEF domain-containing protein
MNLSPNLYLAALGPLSELFAIIIVVAVFALLRSQADRRTYFRSWEASWVFFAVSLTAGVLYERFVDPDSVFYPAGTVTTFVTAATHIAFRLMALAMLVAGTQLYARGTRTGWMPRLAAVVGVVLAFTIDTTRAPLNSLMLVYGVFCAVAYANVAIVFFALPRSRQSVGTRLAALLTTGIALLVTGLTLYFLFQRTGQSISGNPWAVRFARYGFYGDLLLQMGLAWSMVRLLMDDSRRENDDSRARMRLLQDRDTMPEMFDGRTRLLARRAFDSLIGLDFARASFGSVARLHVTNFSRIASGHAPAVAEALVGNIAGVLDSAVRSHDRVYRWSDDELLIVMPRAVPAVARARVEFLLGRAAPLAMPGLKEPLRAEGAVTVEAYTGGEDLAAAAKAVARN